MSIKNQSKEIFNTNNSLKLSLICLTVTHLIWIIWRILYEYNIDLSYNEFTLFLFLCAPFCAEGSGLLLIWVFGLTIKQIYSSYFKGVSSPDKTPSTVTLLCYLISYFLIFVLFLYLKPIIYLNFTYFNNYLVFIYAFVNSIGAFIILIFKLICQVLSFKCRKKASASDNLLTIKKTNAEQKAGTGKFSIKKLLIISAVYLFVLTCSNSIIGRGLMIPYFESGILDILSVVMFLCFILYWIYILLAFAFAIKDSVTRKNQVTRSGLLNYLAFSSAYYLLVLTILYGLTRKFCGAAAGEQFENVWLINYSLYMILNYIGVLIILSVKTFQKPLPE